MTRPRRIAVVINLDWTLKHHQEVFGGIEEYATRKGWQSVLWPFAPEVKDRRGRRLYDGIVGRVHPELEEKARKAGIPLVNVWVSTPCPRVPSVLPDVAMAARMAGEHLRARGFRRFAFVGYSRTRATGIELAGLRELAREHGIKLGVLRVSPTFSDNTRSWSRFQETLRTWAARIQPPVGVLTVNDKVARYLIHAVSERGLDVPGDVAVIGLENEELVCLNPEPSISSVDLGWRHIGRRAGELLGDLMDGKPSPAGPILHPPATLIPRKSTDSFKVADPIVAQALRFIAEQSHNPIKVQDVVAAVPLSWRSLERRFGECRGVTISREIARFRIERAKRLLVETDLLVKQVAKASGFANTRRLCEVFRRVVGTSPEQYRGDRG